VELARASSSQHQAANRSSQVDLGAAAAAAAAVGAPRPQVGWVGSQICLAGKREQQVAPQPRLGLEASAALGVQVRAVRAVGSLCNAVFCVVVFKMCYVRLCIVCYLLLVYVELMITVSCEDRNNSSADGSCL